MTTEQRDARRVLITGAGGQIGRGLTWRLHDTYDLVLLDLPGAFTEGDEARGRLVEADVQDLDALKAAFAGVDTVIHLGGRRSPATLWSDLVAVNITGTYNVVAAAIASGCSRIIYASSVRTVSGYPTGRQVREEDPVDPGDLYGVSKCFGEALGRYAAEQEGISFIALRIGAFQDPSAVAGERSGWMLEEYCAPDDLYDLVQLCIEDRTIRFEIFNAVSANRFSRLDIGKARRILGYEPRFDSFELSAPFSRAAAEAGPLTPWRQPSGMRGEVSPREGNE